MLITWLREGFEQKHLETGEVVTVQTFAEGRGTTVSSINSRLRRYAEDRPNPVGSIDNHQRLYVRQELEDFYNLPVGRHSPRSRKEKVASEVVRLKERIDLEEKRVARHRKDLGKAERDLDHYKKELHRAQEDLTFLSM